MILNKLKFKSVSSRIKKLLKERKLETSAKKITSLLVVLDIDRYDNIADFHRLAKDLQIPDIDYKLIVFSSNKKFIKTYTGRLFTYNKLGWKGVVKDSEIKQVLNTPVDLLINYYDRERVALALLSATAKSKFRVGFPTINRSLNDLIIDCDLQDFELFKSEMIKYLKVLNKL